MRCTGLRTFFCGSTVHDVLTNDCSANAILSGHYDGKLRVWDTRHNEPLKDIRLAGKITSLDCGLGACSLESSPFCQQSHFQIPSWYWPAHARTHCRWSTCARTRSYTTTGKRTASVSKGIMSICSGEAFYCAVDYTRAAMSPQGTYVTCGGKDGQLFVWNAETTRIEKCLHKNAHDGCAFVSKLSFTFRFSHSIIATSWHPLGYQVATIDKKGVVCIWSDI